MGNKTNSLSFRSKRWNNWTSLYYNRKVESSNILVDLKIKNFISDFFFLRNISISNLYLNKNINNKLQIYLTLYPLSSYFNNKTPFVSLTDNFFNTQKKSYKKISLVSYQNDLSKYYNNSKLFTSSSKNVFYILNKKILKSFISNNQKDILIKKSQLNKLIQANYLKNTFNKKLIIFNKDIASVIKLKNIVLSKKKLFNSSLNKLFLQYKVTKNSSYSLLIYNLLHNLIILKNLKLNGLLIKGVVRLKNKKKQFNRTFFLSKLFDFFVYNNNKFINNYKLNSKIICNILTLYHNKNLLYLKPLNKSFWYNLKSFKNRSKYPIYSNISLIFNVFYLFKKNNFLEQIDYNNIIKIKAFYFNNKKLNFIAKGNSSSKYINLINTQRYFRPLKWKLLKIKRITRRINNLFYYKSYNSLIFFSKRVFRRRVLHSFTRANSFAKIMFNYNLFFDLFSNLLIIKLNNNKVKNSNLEFFTSKKFDFKKTNQSKFKFFKKILFFFGFLDINNSNFIQNLIKINYYLLNSSTNSILSKLQFIFQREKKAIWKESINNRFNITKSFYKNLSKVQKNKKPFINKLTRWIQNDYLFFNDKFFYYLLVRYNIKYLNNVIKKITSVQQVEWNFFINNKSSIGTNDLSFIIKKQLQKIRNQRRLVNPLKLVKDQINYNVHSTNKSNLNNNIYLKHLGSNLINFKKQTHYFLIEKFLLLLKNNFKKMYLNNNKVRCALLQKRLKNSKLDNNNKLISNFKLFNYFSYFSNIKLKKQNIMLYNNLLTSNLINIISLFNKDFNKDNKLLYISNLSDLKNKFTTIGYQISGFGRLGFSSKSTRTSQTLYKRGKTAKNSMDTLVDFNQKTLIIRNGIYSIKVWKFYKTSQNNFNYLNSYIC